MYIKALSAVFLLLELATLATAMPYVEKRSFKVERVRNEAFAGHNGPRALAKAYRKYSIPLPPGLVDTLEAQEKEATAARLAKRRTSKWHSPNEDASTPTASTLGVAKAEAGNGTGAAVDDAAEEERKSVIAALARARENNGTATGLVEAIPEPMDVEYLSPVKIGGQTVTLDFDTGSSDLWVFNTQLPAEATAGRRAVYDPARSATFQMMPGAQFTIRYGDGSGAQGNVGTDVVDLGGAVVERQAVELATAVTDAFVQDARTDGLLGLAFSSLNAVTPQRQRTFFDNVMPSLREPLFTADLRANATGAYEFGSVDRSKFTGEMAWVPVNTTQGFWQFSSTRFAVGGGAVQQVASAAAGQAIADTGTTLILADPAIVEGYYSQVPQAQNSQQMGGVVVPCDAKLPDLDLDIGGVYMARVKGEDINFAPVGDNVCFGGLQAVPSGVMGIYGDIMFKSQFVVFNGGNNTLGMAVHA